MQSGSHLCYFAVHIDGGRLVITFSKVQVRVRPHNAARNPLPNTGSKALYKFTFFSCLVGTSEAVTPTLDTSGYSPMTTPTYEKSPLTVAAFGKVLCNLGRRGGGLLSGHTVLDTQLQLCFPGHSSSVSFFSTCDPVILKAQGEKS